MIADPARGGPTRSRSESGIVCFRMLLHASTRRARRWRGPALLATLLALQLVPFGYGASASSPSRMYLSAAITAPAAALPSASVDHERPDGTHGTGRSAPPLRADPPRSVAFTAGRWLAAFCPWRALDALARAGRNGAPTTAPPGSTV